MKTLKEIFKRDNHVWFGVDEEDKVEFLQYAKHNGCKWISGEEINPNEDNCSCFMGINNKRQLGYVSGMCWVSAGKNDVRKIKFKDVLGEVYEKSYY